MIPETVRASHIREAKDTGVSRIHDSAAGTGDGAASTTAGLALPVSVLVVFDDYSNPSYDFT